jgi:ornithine carbamoyltransferase
LTSKLNARLKGRHLLSCQEWTDEEIEQVFELAKRLKKDYLDGKVHNILKQRTFFMIFYATSTRTRNSFEAALTQLGGHAHYLETKTMRIGDHGAPEAIKDTVRVLERYGDGIGVRAYTTDYGDGEKIIREYAKWSRIPVINMESDMYHPCQALADMMTIKECFSRPQGKKYVQAWAYSPHARRIPAVPQSNVLMMTRYGMDVVYVSPSEFRLDKTISEQAKKNAEASGGSYAETTDLKEAMRGAHVVYMRNHTTLEHGQHGSKLEQELMDKYSDWICNDALVDLTEKKSIYMHCLPVDRDHEVSSSVLDGPRSVVFDEAENRLHVQKSILALTIPPRTK